MPRKKEKRPHGEIRQSQILTTFGPGSMTDLPKHSVLIGGLDYWFGSRDAISEPRLARKLAKILEVPTLRLETPPPADDDPTAPPSGVRVFQFPEWFVTQDVESKQADSATRSRLLVHRRALTRGKYRDRDKKARPVVPVRFVRACHGGHIGDIDWYVFVHEGQSECKSLRRQLYLDERGTSGDLAEVFIRCECGKADRSIAQAAKLGDRPLGLCDGARPWLGPAMKEKCNDQNRLLVRTASNAYFPQTLSVISLPDRNEAVQQAVSAVWDFLEAAESLENVQRERKKAKVQQGLDGITDEEAWSEIEARRGVSDGEEKSVKAAELETLVAAREEIGEDRPEGVFYARSLPRAAWDRPWMESIERVVLIHRLREVVASVGFTRFESASADFEGELDMGVRRASLARDISWLPAVENKGEGFFIQFKKSAIDEWLLEPGVQSRTAALNLGSGVCT